jgi:integrase/recombinase XerD
MSSAVEAFCEYITVVKSLSPKTIEAYRYDLDEIERLTQRPLVESDTTMIVNVLMKIENKRTLNRKLSSLNSFLDFCHKSHFDANLSKFRLAKLPKTLPQYLSFESIMNSLESIDKSDWLGLRDYALILFMYATGTRVSECLEVHEEDIEGEWLRVRHGKGEKERYIPIAHEALRALRAYREACPYAKRPLWLNYRYEPLSRISAFKITQKYLGVSPHALRHSYATGLILGGADLRVVQELLGHASLLTTQIYTHVQKHNLQETVLKYHPMVNAMKEEQL